MLLGADQIDLDLADVPVQIGAGAVHGHPALAEDVTAVCDTKRLGEVLLDETRVTAPSRARQPATPAELVS